MAGLRYVDLERQHRRGLGVERVPYEVDVAKAGLLGQSGRQFRLEEPAAPQQRFPETHPGDLDLLERRVEPLVRDPPLLEEDRAEHRSDLLLEERMVETQGRNRARGEP